MKKKLFSLLAMLIVLTGIWVVPASASFTQQAGIVSTKESGLNIRSTPSATGNIVSTAPKGSYLTLVSKTGDWWKVEYSKNQYGYCSSSYITAVSDSYSAEVNTASSNLRVRAGASASSAAVTSLPRGTAVVVLSTANGWSKILYSGNRIGYASANYLTRGQTTTGDAIWLDVPNFKQTDSRWANAYIANSGKTIGKIGCTTTALAMTESHRLGQTITPLTMSKRLSYMADGSLYWPSNYRSITDKSNYLGETVRALRQGKPVIIGAKISSGRQHWVVVTGYNGKGLSPENFSIHDPGSSSRNNLRQFVNDFPIFHKLVFAQ